MATTRKKTELNQEQIVSWYTDYCLLHGKKPKSVYEFSQLNNFDEVNFYKFFNSFEALELDYFSKMFFYSLEIVEKNVEYNKYDSSQKLISFYFTFIEMATANRSFVSFLLDQGKFPIKNITKLKTIRQNFLVYVKTILEAPLPIENESVSNFQNKILHEVAWLQFMAIIRFWLEDKSTSFEKTDIYIEKTVKASFDIVYNVPVESIIDFAKFIWKEKVGSGFTYKN